MEQAELRRNIGLPLLTLYGIGIIIGACIHILIVSVPLIAAALAHDVAELSIRDTSPLLIIFTVANISLIRMKRQQPEAPLRVPVLVPWLGILFSLAALVASWGGAR